ncbi:MAG TPA: hypothetical protein VM577_04930 [Anaerovoracaceae bacterium]|nr:hypothetical protein [Anaerovoracaceae bacterium]
MQGFTRDELMRAWKPEKTAATFTDIERLVRTIFNNPGNGTVFESLSYAITPPVALNMGEVLYEEIARSDDLPNRSQVIETIKHKLKNLDAFTLLENGLKEHVGTSKFDKFMPGSSSSQTQWNDDKVFWWALTNNTLTLSQERYLICENLPWEGTDILDQLLIDCLVENNPALAQSKEFYLLGLTNNVFSTANVTLEKYMPPEFLIDPEFIRSLAKKDLELACHYTGVDYLVGREDISMVQINKYLSKIDLKDQLYADLTQKAEIKSPMDLRDSLEPSIDGTSKTKPNKLKI